MGPTPFEPEERHLVANGLRHRALVYNDGGAPTIVLCHGFLDQAWSFHRVAQPLVRAGRRVVAFDFRGHGDTQHVGAGGYYHFPDYVLDLHELIPRLAPDGVHLVGHSMGGTVAALYAATHPGVLRTLTLVEGLGPPSFAGEPPDRMLGWLDSVERLRTRTPRVIEDVAEARARLRTRAPELPEELATFLADKATKPAPEGRGRIWRFDPLHRTTAPTPFVATTFLTFLGRVQVPTLVIGGSRGFRTEDHAERIAALADVRELEIDDVGHMIHWLKPEPLALAILDHAR